MGTSGWTHGAGGSGGNVLHRLSRDGGDAHLWSVRVGGRPSAHGGCFGPLASLPPRRRRCFGGSLSQDNLEGAHQGNVARRRGVWGGGGRANAHQPANQRPTQHRGDVCKGGSDGRQNLYLGPLPYLTHHTANPAYSCHPSLASVDELWGTKQSPPPLPNAIHGTLPSFRCTPLRPQGSR